MPIVELVFQATKSRVAGCIVSLMLGICFINGTSACTTSVSRLIYAMARDKGIVFHTYFAHLDPRLDVPVRTILFSFVFNVVFGLLYLGPSIAFNAFIASCTIFLNLSYVCPVIVLLIRGRKILDQFRTTETPFQLGIKRGAIINWIATVFVLFTSVVRLGLLFLLLPLFMGKAH
jgi:amino acid transporter